jgi:minichromosome maintenance protein 10
MSTTAGPRRKPAYDPARQWGLKPAEPGTGETYIISGHIVNGSSTDSRSVFISENIGREGQAKARRKIAGKDADKALESMLERDKEGMRAVVKAREVGMKMDMEKSVGKKGKKAEKISKSGTLTEAGNAPTTSSSYSSSVIRSIGFDPAVKPGQQQASDSAVQQKV